MSNEANAARASLYAGLPAATKFDRVLIAIAAVIGLVAAGQNYFVDFGKWRYDLLQAIDDSGTYLFIVSPFYAGLACWAAAREATRLRELSSGLPNRGLAWRTTWPLAALLGIALHATVLIVMVVTALASRALPTFQLLPLLVQFSSIPAFVSFGALVGGYSRNKVLAPTVFLVLLLLNTLLGNAGFRRLSEVGTGSGDFIDIRMSLAYELSKLGIFVAVTVYSLPIRNRWIRWAGSFALAPLIFIGGVFGLAQPGVGPTEYRPGQPICSTAMHGEICVPPVLARYSRSVGSAVGQVEDVLLDSGIRTLPSRVDIVSRAAVYSGLAKYPGRRVAITVTADALHSPQLLLAEVREGYVYGLACPDSSSDRGPSESVILGRATLDGWLQIQLRQVQDGTFPKLNVDRLTQLPVAQREAALESLFDQVVNCRASVSVPGVI